MSIQEDFHLLETMMADEANAPELYRAGPFWRALTERGVRAMREQGISDFRGRSNPAGWAFTDCLFDEREPTEPYCRAISENPKLPELLAKYRLPDTMQCDCIDHVVVNGTRISRHYLNLLDQHDHIASVFPFKTMRCMMELGGGFGAHIHLLVSNYSNIKKIMYLDIPPNLYIGTQYLKMFYGCAVRDYLEMRDLGEMKFRDDDTLEIIATTPWHIEHMQQKIDLFYRSFRGDVSLRRCSRR